MDSVTIKRMLRRVTLSVLLRTMEIQTQGRADHSLASDTIATGFGRPCAKAESGRGERARGKLTFGSTAQQRNSSRRRPFPVRCNL